MGICDRCEAVDSRGKYWPGLAGRGSCVANPRTNKDPEEPPRTWFCMVSPERARFFRFHAIGNFGPGGYYLAFVLCSLHRRPRWSNLAKSIFQDGPPVVVKPVPRVSNIFSPLLLERNNHSFCFSHGVRGGEEVCQGWVGDAPRKLRHFHRSHG